LMCSQENLQVTLGVFLGGMSTVRQPIGQIGTADRLDSSLIDFNTVGIHVIVVKYISSARVQ